MKKKFAFSYFIIGILLVATSCFSFDSKKITEKNKREEGKGEEGKGFTVIELFTSEGCSSCPSADKLISRIKSENKKDVYILSFHVDYWNRLGWKDVFSQPAFTERQQIYATHLSLQGVYTPQIVVNGTEEFVGSDEKRLRTSLKNNVNPSSDLIIEVSQINNSNIHLAYKNANSNSELLNIAFIQPEAITDVKRGENGGRRLHHVNIVREFKTIQISGAGNLDIKVPAALHDLPFKIIAYTQQKNSFKVTGVAQASVIFNRKQS